MAFSSGSSSPSAAEINVTPLIDVLLVLLIIFMVIGPTLPHGMDSSIPSPSPRTVPQEQPLIVQVHAGATGTLYRIGSQQPALSEIRATLQTLLARRSDRAVFVQADRSLEYREVAEVVSEVRAAGTGSVALMNAAQPH